jgi:hypothetical protein
MSSRAARLSWSLCLLWVALLAAAGVFDFLNGPDEGAVGASDPWGTASMDIIYLVVVVAFAFVGALVASRQPKNPIGWMCLAVGLILTLSGAADEYGVYALEATADSLSGGEYAAWLSNWLWIPAVFLIATFLVLLFPDGRLPSRRWRVVAWLAAAALVSASLSEAFSPGRLEEARANVTNPLAIESASTTLEVLGACGIALLPLCCLAAAFSMVLRFRRSTREERQQIKWFASAAALLAVSFPFAFALSSGVVEDFVTLTFAGLPVAVGTAVLRYRLYDIDVLINRTLVYGSLTAMLVAVYFGGVVSLQYVFRALSGQETTLAVVASTLAIAALFNPLRRRIQGFIDRRFYRSKYDAAKTLEAFSAKLRDETDLDALSDDLVGVVRETMQPAHVSLWLRPDMPRNSQQGKPSASA